MTPHTAEWVRDAEKDLRTAEREFIAPTDPNYDAVCFHAQQCAEKYLKARLVEAGMMVPRTHNLADLLTQLQPAEPSYSSLLNAALALGSYAVTIRYPGLDAEQTDAQDALNYCRQVRSRVRQSLGLPL